MYSYTAANMSTRRLFQSISLGHQSLARLSYQRHWVTSPCASRSLHTNKKLYSAEANVQQDLRIKEFSEIPDSSANKIRSYYNFLKNHDSMHFVVRDLHGMYGPIFRSKMGPYNSIFINDAEAIEELVRNEAKVPERLMPVNWKVQWDELGQSYGLLLSEGDDWYRMRKAVNKVMLNTHKVSSAAERINPVTADLLQYMASKRAGDNTIVLNDFIYKWSLETIGNVLLERRFGLLSDNPYEEGKKMIQSVQNFFISSGPTSALKPALTKVLMRKYWIMQRNALDYMFNFCIESVNARLEQIEKNPGLSPGMLEYLIEHVGEEESKMTKKELFANMIELMSAGVDTTSNSVLFCLAELSKHRDLQEQIHKEIMAASSSPDDMPTAQTLQDTPLLRAAAKESLRMCPVAATLGRTLQKDTVIMGYNVPAGITVAVGLYALGRDSAYYRDPDSFRPERWLRGSEERNNMNPFSFLPFGFGTRSCIGRRVAELEMHIMLYQLLRKYRMVSTSNEPTELSWRLVMAPKKPVEIRLIER